MHPSQYHGFMFHYINHCQQSQLEAYMVLALNTVCDVYFAGSIDLLCEAWDLTPDVAGATCSHCDTSKWVKELIFPETFTLW